MHKIGYADTADHKQEHEQLLKQVIDLQVKYESNAGALSIQVLHFLCDWLVNHIGKSDVVLARASRALHG